MANRDKQHFQQISHSQYAFTHQNGFNYHRYPALAKYTAKVYSPPRRTLGRADKMNQIECFLDRPIYSNVILLGDPGCGKTAIVEELARQDKTHEYFSVDLDKMASSAHLGSGSGATEMAYRMKLLMQDVISYQSSAMRAKKVEKERKEYSTTVPDQGIVLFMDEFHKLEMESGAAAQAIKPILAHSGEFRIRIIAADTFKEFAQFIKPDEALTQRLQTIVIDPPTDNVVLRILKNMMKKYEPKTHTAPGLLHRIIRVTDKYMLSQSQPRKSIRVLDNMIGAHRHTGDAMNEKLLATTMMTSYGIRIDWNVDVNHLEQYLDSHVIAQHQASYLLAQQLYISVAGLEDHDRPQGSFLFTGTTGVGKTEMAKQLTKILLGNSHDMVRFDMANFARLSSLDTFRDELTERVSEHSNYVILFDEIEKANPAITRVLLPVLDDGELADRFGRTVSFRNAYIVMTTNAGSDVYRAINDLTSSVQNIDSGHWADQFTRLIRRTLIEDPDFPTEFLNRLDAFIPFKPLDRNAKRIIAFMYLQQISTQIYNMYGINLHIEGDDPTTYLNPDTDKRTPFIGNPADNKTPYRCGVLSYVVDDQRDDSTDAGGARGVKSIINRSIKAKVARFICEHRSCKNISIKVHNRMSINMLHSLKDDAYIQISPWKPDYQPTRVQQYDNGDERRVI